MSDKVTGQTLFLWRQKALEAAIVSGVPPIEVDWLLREVAGLDSLEFRLESYKERPAIDLTLSLSDLTHLWQRRLKEHLPVQYIAGVTPWRDLTLKVSPSVLIPRPETEFLIDIVLQIVEKEPWLNEGPWVDLGTGSGAVAIGLAKVLTKPTIYAVDLSEAALEIAKDNIERYGLEEKIKLVQGSWWSPLEFLKNTLTGTVKVMVSNPPYIPGGLIEELQAEVREHEPLLALDGGEDGLVAIRHLVKTSPEYLCPGGVWLIEIMVNQSNSVVKLLEEQKCYGRIEIFKDLAGIERYVLARVIS